jgi:hypothetical protein
VIDDEWTRIVGVGGAMIAGVADRDGLPHALRVWAVAFPEAGAPRARVVVGDPEGIVGDWMVGGRMAVTGGDVDTLACRQMKGTLRWVGTLTDDDLSNFAEQSEGFVARVHLIDGTPSEMVRRIVAAALAVVEVEVDEMYDQSPGPSAGTAVAR